MLPYRSESFALCSPSTICESLKSTVNNYYVASVYQTLTENWAIGILLKPNESWSW